MSEAGFTGFIGFTGLGSLNCDFCDLWDREWNSLLQKKWTENARGVRTTLYPFLRFCVIRNKLTFLWELLYPIKIPCWGALLGPV